MITEKDLLKWGFEKEQTILETTYMFAISTCSRNELAVPTEYVYVSIDRREVSVGYAHNYIFLANCTTKRKADQALRLLNLPPIDKLSTLKQEAK